MKNLLFLLLILVGCVSCEKEMDTYEGGSGIYFADGGLFSDTLRVAWGLKNSDVKKQSIQLKVCLYGNTADYDRKFNIEIYSDTDTLSAIEGVDFKAFDTEYVVKLIENPELQFIYTREVAVQIDSVNFKMRDIDYQRVIVMNENFPMPAWWYVYGTKYFGVWTQKKSSLICDVMGIDREDFVGTKLTEGYLKFVGKYMHRWLQDNPHTDEDGKPMEMGEASKG